MADPVICRRRLPGSFRQARLRYCSCTMRLWGLLLLVGTSFVVASGIGVVTIITLASFPSELDEVPLRLAEVVVHWNWSHAYETLWPIWIGAGFIAITQGCFLLPTFSPITRTGQPRSLRWSVLGASGMAAVLSTAWLLAFISLFWSLFWEFTRLSASSFLVVFIAQFVVVWILWHGLIWRRMTQHDTPESWAIRRVLAGSGLLIVGTIPIDVIVRRKSFCYCSEVSLFALTWGVGGAFWCFGPAIFLGRSRRMRRALRGTFCRRCGHARGPAGEAICQECGLEYRFPPTSEAKSG